MKIRILRTTVADQRIVRAGDIEDVSDRDALTLIQLGKAVAHDAAVTADPIVASAPDELTTDDAAPLIAESKPGKGRRKGR